MHALKYAKLNNRYVSKLYCAYLCFHY